MEITVALVAVSHLSDCQELSGSDLYSTLTRHQRINFVKYLLIKYPETSQLINAEEEWGLFMVKHYINVSQSQMDKILKDAQDLINS